ncbi:MAG: hypothetical protein DMG49_25350 [Acidobacteria bacterium]|nr:MAG: hypothetical protein DMG49_25350 [Acidobacteriota bacterium]
MACNQSPSHLSSESRSEACIISTGETASLSANRYLRRLSVPNRVHQPTGQTAFKIVRIAFRLAEPFIHPLDSQIQSLQF